MVVMTWKRMTGGHKNESTIVIACEEGWARRHHHHIVIVALWVINEGEGKGAHSHYDLGENDRRV